MGLRSSRWIFSIRASSSISRGVTSFTTTGTSLRPARRAARQRRSPAMIWYCTTPVSAGEASNQLSSPALAADPGAGGWGSVSRRVTTRGWSRPYSLIEALNSSRRGSSSRKTLRGWRGLGIICSTGTVRMLPLSTRVGCCAAITSEAPEISASRPRPRPNFGLATCHYLLGQRAVRDGAWGCGIVIEDRLAKARCLAQAHVAVNNGLEDLFRKVIAHLAHDLAGQPGAGIKHRQHHAGNVESGIQFVLHNLDRVQQMRQALQGQILALDRNDQAVRRHQRVDGQQAQRGRTIDNNVSQRWRIGSMACFKRFSRARAPTSSTSAAARSTVQGATTSSRRFDGTITSKIEIISCS